MRSEVERKQTLSHINSRIDTSLARACGHMYEEHTAHTHTRGSVNTPVQEESVSHGRNETERTLTRVSFL